MAAADDGADDAATRPPWGEVGRIGTLAAIAAASKLYLRVLNATSITGEEDFHKVVLERECEQGLITVSNHTRWIFLPGSIHPSPWHRRLLRAGLHGHGPVHGRSELLCCSAPN